MRSDEQLAREAQQNIPGSLQELVQRHHAPLFGFLYRLAGGDRALAEDLTQDTFLRVVQSLAQYRYPQPFKPWLYAIAANRARDHYRQADSRRTRSVTAQEESAGVDPGDPPEETLARLADVQRVGAALRELPYTQREVLILRYSQGLALAEIAGILHLPLGTVKSRLSLGLRRLRRLVEEA
jgi:RNA polymerase sigma-70 factor (ECF subfamily)